MQKYYCFIAIVILSAAVYSQTKVNNKPTNSLQNPAPLDVRAGSPDGVAFNNEGIKKVLKKLFAEATKDFRKAIELLPDCLECLYNLGCALNETGGQEEAAEIFKKLVAIKKDYRDAYLGLGDALGETGKFEEGIAAYREALKLGPADAVTLSNMGHSLEQLQRHDEALRALDEAIKLDPKFAKAYNNRGVTLFAMGKVKDAVESFRKALALAAGSAEICNNLGVALDKLGKKEAHQYFEEAVRLRPAWGYAVFNLGMSNLKRGERDIARLQLSSLERIDTELAQRLRKEILAKFIVEVPGRGGNPLRQ